MRIWSDFNAWSWGSESYRIVIFEWDPLYLLRWLAVTSESSIFCCRWYDFEKKYSLKNLLLIGSILVHVWTNWHTMPMCTPSNVLWVAYLIWLVQMLHCRSGIWWYTLLSRFFFYINMSKCIAMVTGMYYKLFYSSAADDSGNASLNYLASVGGTGWWKS